MIRIESKMTKPKINSRNKIFFKAMLLFNLFCIFYLSLGIQGVEEEFKLDQILHHGIDFPTVFRTLNMDESKLRANEKVHKMSFVHGIKRLPMPVKSNAFRMNAGKGRQFHVYRRNLTIPDVKDKSTILSLARMTFNAYIQPTDPDWMKLGDDLNKVDDFGWEEEDDGLRGYVFANKDNSSLIVSFKGTSAGLVSGDSKTSAKDKKNDNLLFSCCCARIDQTWYTSCKCFQNGNKCSLQCLENTLSSRNEDIYYYAAQNILKRIEDTYPKAEIWLTGHSLGGGLAALLGLTYNLPTVTFQSPGDLRASKRLKLPTAPGLSKKDEHIWHFGHNADPIFMGECQGVLSACYIGGYAMESKCHTGKICMYDTKKEKKWGSDILKHRIGVVIEEVINHFDEVPECIPENPKCKDCEGWDYTN